jgi:hypothetical protein
MADNIVVGAVVATDLPTPTRYVIPLNFENVGQQTEVTVTLGNIVLNLFFNLNPILNILFLSSYTLNKTSIYFYGYQCVFGNYINKIDNGCPFKFYFVDQSNGQNFSKNSENITYIALSNGVKLYAELR